MELMIIYMVAALLISGLCSVLEATLMSTPMSYISSLEAQAKKGAALLKKYKLDIERPISAILVLNTIANTVAKDHRLDSLAFVGPSGIENHPCAGVRHVPSCVVSGAYHPPHLSRGKPAGGKP